MGGTGSVNPDSSLADELSGLQHTSPPSHKRPGTKLKSLRALLVKGLDRTRTLWPDVRRGFRWVHAAARILKNSAGRAADEVETRYTRLLEAWRARRNEAGTLADAVDRFLKVTDSYRPGLFHCLRVPGLPATNNDLEQFFRELKR